MNALIKSRGQRIRVARRLTRIFNEWQLSDRERIRLLGLRRNGMTTLERYSRGSPLAQKAELLERAILLLEIHLSLDVYFGSGNKVATREWLYRKIPVLSICPHLAHMTMGIDELREVRRVATSILLNEEEFLARRQQYFSWLGLITAVKPPAMSPINSPSAMTAAVVGMVARKPVKNNPT